MRWALLLLLVALATACHETDPIACLASDCAWFVGPKVQECVKIELCVNSQCVISGEAGEWIRASDTIVVNGERMSFTVEIVVFLVLLAVLFLCCFVPCMMICTVVCVLRRHSKFFMRKVDEIVKRNQDAFYAVNTIAPDTVGESDVLE